MSGTRVGKRASWESSVGACSDCSAETESRTNMQLFLFCCRFKKKRKLERSRVVDLWNRQQQVADSLRYYTEIRMLKSELISAILLRKKTSARTLPREAVRFHIT